MINEINIKELSQNNNNSGFTEDQIKEALKILENSNIIESQLKDVIDLRFLKTYTIDNNNSTKEIDDAISLQKSNGIYIIWIHISCPSVYIPIDSILDNEAKKRISSIYYVDKVITMFPEILITNKLSLIQNQDKIALSVGIVLNDDGSILNTYVSKSLVNVNYNLSYNDANELIDLRPKEDKDLEILYKFLCLRQTYRIKKGGFDIVEARGKPEILEDKVSINYIEPSNSRFIIREAMILMGSAIALFAAKNRIITPFRCQDKALEEFKITNNNIIDNYQNKSKYRNTYYSLEPRPHSGLGLDCYVQATSPIRRYIDFIIHHQILSFIENNPQINEEKLMIIANRTIKIIKEQKNLIRLNYQKAMTLFFNQHNNIIWSAYLLRTINTKSSSFLIHFIDLSMELIIKINNIDNHNFIKIYKIRLKQSNEFDNELSFNIV